MQVPRNLSRRRLSHVLKDGEEFVMACSLLSLLLGMREMRGWRPSLSAAAVQAFIYFPSHPPSADAAQLKGGAC